MTRDEKIDIILELYAKGHMLPFIQTCCDKFGHEIQDAKECERIKKRMEAEDLIETFDMGTVDYHITDRGQRMYEYGGWIKFLEDSNAEEQEKKDAELRGIERAQREFDLKLKSFKWNKTATITNIIVGLINLVALSITIWLNFGKY